MIWLHIVQGGERNLYKYTVEIDGGRNYLYTVWWLLHEVNEPSMRRTKLLYDKTARRKGCNEGI